MKKDGKGQSVTVWAALAVGAVGIGVVLAFLGGYFLGHYTGHENTTTVSMVPAGGASGEAGGLPAGGEGEEAAEGEGAEAAPPPPKPKPKPKPPSGQGGSGGGEKSGAGAGASLAAGKTVFTTNCGSCHTLSEAGTSGNVGPNLDELKPEKALVETQVTNGGGVMPAFGETLSSKEIEDVAEYVSTVAGTGK